MSTDDRMETITDPEQIRAVWEAGDMGEESLGGDSESGTYNRSNRPPAGPRPDADNPWALLPDDHPERPKQCGGCGTKWVDAETARACERRHGDDITTPAAVGAGLDLDAVPRLARLVLVDALDRAESAEAEVRRLTRWQFEAMSVMAGLQGLGSALGMRLGESITGHAAAEAARALTARAEAAEAEVVTLRARLAAVEALAKKRDVLYPPKFTFDAATNYVNGYRQARADFRAALSTGEGE